MLIRYFAVVVYGGPCSVRDVLSNMAPRILLAVVGLCFRASREH